MRVVSLLIFPYINSLILRIGNEDYTTAGST